MAYGSAHHLWIFKPLTGDQASALVRAHASEGCSDDLRAYRVGERTLFTSVGHGDRELRGRSVSILEQLAQAPLDGRWCFVAVLPDHDQWTITSSTGVQSSSELEDGDVGPDRSSAEQQKQARAIIEEELSLPLKALHHYVDFGHSLLDTPDGSASRLLPAEVVRRLELSLPSAPPAGAVSPTSSAKKPFAVAWASLVACIALSAFTVSVTQPPGPDAFIVRAVHLAIQSALFWLLFAFKVETPVGMRRGRLVLTGLGVCLGGALAWGMVPF